MNRANKLKVEKLFRQAEKLNNEFVTSEESLELYKAVIAIDCNHAGALNRIGHYLFQTANYSGALDKFQKAAVANPKQRYVNWNIGTALEALYGPSKESLQYKMKAIRLDPEFYLDRPEMKFGLWNLPKTFLTKMRKRLAQKQMVPMLLLAGCGLSAFTKTRATKHAVIKAFQSN